MEKLYCNSLTEYKRFNTRVVNIGDVAMGGKNPVRIQSMTNTNTLDTKASVDQIIRMVDSGCEIVRLTAPSIKDAENLAVIKNELKKLNCNVPLVADIHFTPNAAEVAARIVEKVRVNPGNYVDKKKFNQIEYTDAEYNAELERIYERFSPLVKICKDHGTAMRIGTNHGSLSDRIMSRYGDTPLGMVESALEFARICEDLKYYDLVFSMKASNTRVMVQAYRLLVSKMIANNMNYPIHLGVTEAGDGEDARIKSAVGIGTLLEDGIGDTIRISLTEPPEFEAPVAIDLANRYKNRNDHEAIVPIEKNVHNPYTYNKRKSVLVENIGEKNLPVVFADLSNVKNISKNDLAKIGYSFNYTDDKWNIEVAAADYIYLGKESANIEFPPVVKIVQDYDVWKISEQPNSYPLFSFNEFIKAEKFSNSLNFVTVSTKDIYLGKFTNVANKTNVVLILTSENKNSVADIRRTMFELMAKDIYNPIVLSKNYSSLSKELLQLYASTDLGSLLTDGFGDGVFIYSNLEKEFVNRTLFGILQAARVRVSKTEYISCPSCGRTQFDLVEVTTKIKERTNHLVGVKIGIMGCIVNGPGEMADADYGYVGAGAGKISLYRGQTVVKKGLSSENAVDELIELIKEDGNWTNQK
ncbi:MAG: (E)-4-hydroxy-3-methylbut-2-enyl-diphosphate synthase [Melioribacteraceae bacterium]|nr:(E)-4-hydroxy-3-methylbut-2-enyl-diphosphate synthase [Melioribacteraceae bacterium]